MLKRFWFDFDLSGVSSPPLGIGLGCGITAYSYEDAVGLLDSLRLVCSLGRRCLRSRGALRTLMFRVWTRTMFVQTWGMSSLEECGSRSATTSPLGHDSRSGDCVGDDGGLDNLAAQWAERDHDIRRQTIRTYDHVRRDQAPVPRAGPDRPHRDHSTFSDYNM